MHKNIILASQSPRRKLLLEQAEVKFKVDVVDTDEAYPKHLSVKQIPIHIATQKAKAVAHKHKDAIIIAADTIVVLEDTVIGKPKDQADAIHILQKLSGNTHQVITGVYIMHHENVIAFSDVTNVVFNPLSNDQIKHYVSEYKPFDKAGAYAIQEWIGAIGIKSIDGDFYNVMGLPINRVVKALLELSVQIGK